MAAVRRPAVAGTWYPGDRASLAAEIEGFLADVPPVDVPGRLVALISPHAGLRYSGPVAAHAYARLRGRRDLTAVLVGPSHRVHFEGVSVYARGAFATPLGEIPIDEPVAEALLAADEVLLDEPSPHRDEHSLEMQLPFLQHLVPGLRIVPLLMGSQEREVDALAGALGRASGARARFGGSSDLSHYHRPWRALDARSWTTWRGSSEGLMNRLSPIAATPVVGTDGGGDARGM
jgi:AmmeMemoRadiSam system protein B